MRVAIIGGSGKMGRWFASFLRKEGKEVVITGRNEGKLLEAKRQLGVEVASNEAAVRSADVVLLSVPIDNFEQVVKELASYTNSRQIIVDITSIKALPVEAMHRHIKNGTTLGVHPLFGPGAKDIAGKTFALTPTSDGEFALAQKVRQYLEKHGAKVTIMSPQEHDELMAIVLGLPHFVALVSGETLAGLDRLRQLEGLAGSTCKLLLTLVGSVLSEDPEFYASLQMSLPGMANIEQRFQQSAKSWADLVRNRNKEEFVTRMNLLRDKLEKAELDLRKSYENMYRIVDGP